MDHVHSLLAQRRRESLWKREQKLNDENNGGKELSNKLRRIRAFVGTMVDTHHCSINGNYTASDGIKLLYTNFDSIHSPHLFGLVTFQIEALSFQILH